jgi:hypothetical protein
MDLRWPAKQGREVALRVLLSLVLGFAPLLAQAAMSGPPSASLAQHAIASVALQSDSGHVGHDHNDEYAVIGHSHDITLAHGDTLASSDQDHRLPTPSVTDAAPCPSGHGDHDNAADTGCCGTFCHSVTALLAVPSARHNHGRATFIAFFGMPTESVAPDQPHRPPSFLMSL